MSKLLERCVCGCRQSTQNIRHGLPIEVCSRCSIVRQSVDMTKKELDSFYQGEYYTEGGENKHSHTYAHDHGVAKKRLTDYGLTKGSRLLDLGSGNSAFVKAARKRGIQAYGCEPSEKFVGQKFVYSQDLFDIHFPTDYFDTITIHDTLEHMVDPVGALQECFRILKQGGQLILDIPHFFSRKGKHHWKPVEHLWMFTAPQARDILHSVGLEPQEDYNPIPSKIVIRAEKPHQKRPTLLLPPGIGDCYWVLVKLEAIMKRLGIPLPDAYVSSPNNYTKDHSFEYIQRVPFVNAAGYKKHNSKENVFQEAYRMNRRSIFQDVMGCDYFISYNGILEAGRSLDKVDDYKTNWMFPLFQPYEERAYGAAFRAEHGPYMVAYFIPHGTYQRWLTDFDIKHLHESLALIAKRSGRKIVLIGAGWDKGIIDKGLTRLGGDFLINRVGQTNLDQCFGLLRNADCVIGYPSGVTITSAHMGTPTFMLWNNHFHENFYWFSCPPQARGAWYDLLDTSKTTVRKLAEGVSKLVGYPNKCQPLKKVKKISKKKLRKHGVPKDHPNTLPVEAHTVRARSKNPVVACVLKSGGDFGVEHVLRLQHSIKKNTTISIDFMCLSDVSLNGHFRSQKLISDLPGLHSKLELFRSGVFDPKVPVAYFDLDTVILGNIDVLFQREHIFSSLHGWNPTRVERVCSAIMVWKGDYSKIYDDYTQPQVGTILPWWGEQTQIENTIKKEYGVKFDPIQDMLPVVSYKRQCVPNGGTPPPGTKIVCFHGKPRPEDVMNSHSWIKESWK